MTIFIWQECMVIIEKQIIKEVKYTDYTTVDRIMA